MKKTFMKKKLFDGFVRVICASLLALVVTTIAQAQSSTPTLTITSGSALNVDSSLTATATTTAASGQGGAITFLIFAGSGSATVDPDTGLLTAIGTGTVTLTANSAGDSNYYAASTSQELTIGQATPTLTITSSNSLDVDGILNATVVTSATFGRGGAISFDITSGSGSAIVDPASGLITGISAGTVTLVASSAGDADYSAASTSQELIISAITPTLTITSSNSLDVDGTLNATVVTSATFGRGGAISFAITSGSGSATVDAASGLITGIGSGTVTLVASSAGDVDYSAASTSQELTISAITPTLTITSSNSLDVDGTLNATVVTSATFGRGGAITFDITNGTGAATVDPTSGFITGVSAGTVTLVASSAGDADYNSATVSQELTIAQITPTLTITSPNTLDVDGTLSAVVETSATFGRGGAISFAITSGSGSATVDPDSGLITGVGSGTVTLVANSAGDADYSAASTSQELIISAIIPTLTITSLDTLDVDGTLTVTVVTTATGGRGGAITFDVTSGSGSATVDPTTGFLTAISSGTVTLTASSAGDIDYGAVTTSQLITIAQATPVLTITLPGTLTFGNPGLTATTTTSATGGRGGVITYSITAGSGSATVDSTTGFVEVINAGTITITAESVGDADYNAATTNLALTIAKATPVLTFTSASSVNVDATLHCSITSTTSNGGTVTYSVMYGTGIAILNSGTSGILTGVQVGNIVLKATSAGSANYNPVSVTQTIAITKATPTLNITSGGSVIVGHTLQTVATTTATYGRGGARSYAITAGSGSATVNASGLVTAVSVGTVTVTVTTPGDANYYAATRSKLITITSSSMLMAEHPAKTTPEENNPSLIQNPTALAPEDITSPNTDVVDQGLVIPQALSPNGDGFDDLFEIQNISKYPNNELIIANKKGEAVFKAHGYDNQTVIFTGKSSTGAELENGMYYYLLTFYNNGQVNTLKGYFKLKK